ncbi:hypothetical protein HN51_062412, partial [Arachis hypogaea]
RDITRRNSLAITSSYSSPNLAPSAIDPFITEYMYTKPCNNNALISNKNKFFSSHSSTSVVYLFGLLDSQIQFNYI